MKEATEHFSSNLIDSNWQQMLFTDHPLSDSEIEKNWSSINAAAESPSPFRITLQLYSL